MNDLVVFYEVVFCFWRSGSGDGCELVVNDEYALSGIDARVELTLGLLMWCFDKANTGISAVSSKNKFKEQFKMQRKDESND